MKTIKGIDINLVSKETALKFCYQKREDYVRGFDSIDEGIRAFDCLISILESDTIKVSDLPEYGISDRDI